MNFDGDFNMLMAQEDIPFYQSEQFEYMDEDGEIHIATREYRKIPINNVDTFELQEAFIASVCPQLLNYG
jgi:hypothetical protein